MPNKLYEVLTVITYNGVGRKRVGRYIVSAPDIGAARNISLQENEEISHIREMNECTLVVTESEQ